VGYAGSLSSIGPQFTKPTTAMVRLLRWSYASRMACLHKVWKGKAEAMRQTLTFLLLAAAISCSHQPPDDESKADQRQEWLRQVTIETIIATRHMNKCAAGFWQTSNLPICKTSCEEYAAIRSKELDPPDFVGPLLATQIIDDVSQSSVCKGGETHQKGSGRR
jgi:hypothetical protein